MSKPRHWWLAKSVSDDDDTLTAYDVDGDNEDWMATKGIYVVEKSAADKLAEALVWALDNMNPPFEFDKFVDANKALKEYRGERN